ncbi:chitosanase [Streptomyces sp. NPDC087440]|uniref:chitosanase n=1 Tax=Streptomyces sp. NPDC087440 TaxID=3365790 RepID=UPI0037FAFF0B
MKPLTRLVLIGAPVAIVATAAFGGAPKGDDPIYVDPWSTETTADDPKPDEAKKPKTDQEVIAKLPPGLADPVLKDRAAQIISTAENSTTHWQGQYANIRDVKDGNGYTAGVIGFTSGTHDMLQLIQDYTKTHPNNPLASYIPALVEVDGTASHEGLDPGFTKAWKQAAKENDFIKAQDAARDKYYFKPAVDLAKMDGLGTLGQFIYYDAMVLHGPGVDKRGFYGIRDSARAKVKTPSELGGKDDKASKLKAEKAYLNAFLDETREVLRTKKTLNDTSRIDTAQRVFLKDGNMDLKLPLKWKMYEEDFSINQ